VTSSNGDTIAVIRHTATFQFGTTDSKPVQSVPNKVGIVASNASGGQDGTVFSLLVMIEH